jgi:hypothetical protein
VTAKTLVVDVIDEEWWGELIQPVLSPVGQEVPSPQPEAVPQSEPKPELHGTWVLLSHLKPDSATGTKPIQYRFAGQRVPVDTWIDLLHKIVPALTEAGNLSAGDLTSLHGRLRPSFAVTPDPLRHGVWVPSLDLWMESNIGAKGVISLLHRLLDLAKLDRSSLELELLQNSVEPIGV